MGELYSISGIFIEIHPGISPWGGFFFLGASQDDPLNSSLRPNELEGMLVDCYGHSTINGEMIPGESLHFEKHYHDRPDDSFFNYDFEFQKGVWVGTYRYSEMDKTDKSVCRTSQIFSGLNFHPIDNSPEAIAKSYIDEMVRTGDLIETFDDSGERYISLPEEGQEPIN